MEETKKLQRTVGKVVLSFVKVSDANPDIWKDENWDSTFGLVESIAELITVAAGGVDPNPVIDNIMRKCGR